MNNISITFFYIIEKQNEDYNTILPHLNIMRTIIYNLFS